jgi:hypothetical protein
VSAETVWTVEHLTENTYRFRYVAEGAAGQIKIIGANGDLFEPHGPVGKHHCFDSEIPPGDYTISWHWMESRPDIRPWVDFTVPFRRRSAELVALKTHSISAGQLILRFPPIVRDY